MKKNLLLLVAFILTATVFIACGGDGSTPTAAAEKCAELLKAGDYEGITNQLAFDENASKEDIDATKAMLVAMGKEKSEKQLILMEIGSNKKLPKAWLSGASCLFIRVFHSCDSIFFRRSSRSVRQCREHNFFRRALHV